MAQVPILFFAANPEGTPRLAVGDELRAIQAKLRASEYRNTLRLIPWLAAQPDDLVQGLSEIRPAIVHFTGHGDSAGDLAMQDPDGNSIIVPKVALESLFRTLKGDIRLVVLNACYSGAQARSIADHIDCVVGMNAAIHDEASRAFAAALYRGLGFGCSVRNAFDQALTSLQLGGWGGQHIPCLIVRDGVDADEVVPVRVEEEDSLARLPEVPRVALPGEPFRYLAPLDERYAELLFGRDQEIRRLYECVTDDDARPLTLVFGQSGVGKSSLLLAGIKPRLTGAYEVLYVRRDPERGLYRTLLDAVDGDWFAFEERAGRPVVVILDQVEEAFTRPLAVHSLAGDRDDRVGGALAGPGEAELDDLAELAVALFGLSATRPQGRLVLSFRKEWLPEVDKALEKVELPGARVFIERLGKRGIQQVVRGLESTARLRSAFPVTIESDLDVAIASDLLADPDSPVAPTLSILMTRLWREAGRPVTGEPVLSHDLYHRLRRDGLHLTAFLRRQLDAVAATHPEPVECGLVLDVLEHHTTSLGTARQWTRAELHEAYDHLPGASIDAIVESLEACYLLVEPRSLDRDRLSDGITRLAHDTLAPVVRDAFQTSQQPGQVTRRVLENRAAERDSGAESAAMDEATFALVRRGLTGMRQLRSAERALLEEAERASVARRAAERAAQRAREMRNTAVVVVSVVVLGLGWVSVANYRGEREASERASLAGERFDREAATKRDILRVERAEDLDHDPTRQIAWLRQVEDPTEMQDWLTLAHRVLNDRVAHAILSSGNGPIDHAMLNSDGSCLLTVSRDGTAGLWHLEGHHSEFTPLPEIAAGARSEIAGEVTRAIFSPDDRMILAVVKQRYPRIWMTHDEDGGDGGRLIDLPEHRRRVTAIAFSADSRLVATGSDHGMVILSRVDDLSRVDETRIFRWKASSGKIKSLVFSPDHRYILAVSRKVAVIRRVDGAGESVVLSGHTGQVNHAEFSPDGARVVTASADRTLQIWRTDRIESGDIARNTDGRLHCRYKDSVFRATFGPDGGRILTELGDRTVQLCQADDPCQCQEIARHRDPVRLARFDASGSRVVTGSRDGIAYVSTPGDSSPFSTEILRGHTDELVFAGFGQDGDRVITASRDGTVRIWWLGDASWVFHRVVDLRGHGGFVTGAGFSPDGVHVATISGETVRIWLVATGELLHELRDADRPLQSISYSADGAHLIAHHGAATRWCWRSDGTRESASSCPDVAASENPDLDITPRAVWVRLPGERDLMLRGHDKEILGAAMDSRGRRVITFSKDRTARIWTLRDTEEIMEQLWQATPYCLSRQELEKEFPRDSEAIGRVHAQCEKEQIRRTHDSRATRWSEQGE